MNVILSKTPEELGKKAASCIASLLNEAIEKNGSARIILSTGASQFTTIEALIQEAVDWTKVEMFHLDEYIELGEEHPASFIKYLKERFVSKVSLKQAHFVDTSQGVEAIIDKLTKELNAAPVDVGVIGIGENAHLAFNDPPADFETKAAYKIVQLDEACRKQQLREGWFPNLEAVPKEAISMTVHQILQCKAIVSAVPFKVKAQAIKATLENEVTNQIPATALKQHSNVTLFIDEDSASLIDQEAYR